MTAAVEETRDDAAVAEPSATTTRTRSPGLEPVPAVDTAVIPVEAIHEHLQRTEAEPGARRSAAAGCCRSSPCSLLLLAIVVLTIWGLAR